MPIHNAGLSTADLAGASRPETLSEFATFSAEVTQSLLLREYRSIEAAVSVGTRIELIGGRGAVGESADRDDAFFVDQGIAMSAIDFHERGSTVAIEQAFNKIRESRHSC